MNRGIRKKQAQMDSIAKKLETVNGGQTMDFLEYHHKSHSSQQTSQKRETLGPENPTVSCNMNPTLSTSTLRHESQHSMLLSISGL